MLEYIIAHLTMVPFVYHLVRAAGEKTSKNCERKNHSLEAEPEFRLLSASSHYKYIRTHGGETPLALSNR